MVELEKDQTPSRASFRIEGTEEEVLHFVIYLWPELHENHELEDDEKIDKEVIE